jgi:hypothetical protein
MSAPSSAASGFLQAHRAYSKNAADRQEALAYELKTVDEESGTIRLSKIEVVGGLKDEVARSAVMKEMDAINRCFTRAGVEKSSLQGEWIFTLLVGPDGRVREAQVAKRSAATEELSRCILEILRAIRFHADSGRQDVTLKLTFSVR